MKKIIEIYKQTKKKNMEIRKCANCGKEIDLDDKASFKTIMHHQMHRYVCNNNKCMYEFYTHIN